MEGCWQVLGIEPTNDERAVKRAYAAKLKVTRPDEKPGEFQQLHDAYKQASWIAASNMAHASWDDDDEDDDVVEPDFVQVVEFQPVDAGEEPEIIQVERSAPDAATAPLVAGYDEELSALRERVAATLSDHLALHRWSSWQYLENHPDILESEFRDALGAAVIKQVAEHNLKFTGRRGAVSKVPPEILARLNQIFQWNVQPQILWGVLTDAEYDEVVPLLDVRRVRPSETKILGGAAVRQVDGTQAARPVEKDKRGFRIPWFAVAIGIWIVFQILQQAAK